MKKRTGFVTNSSSTCYVCEVCNNDCSGMDVCLSDCYMTQCQNGHTFCDEHLIDAEITQQNMLDILLEATQNSYDNYTEWAKEKNSEYYNSRAKEMLEEIEKLNQRDFDYIEGEYNDLVIDKGVHPKQCPICQLEHIPTEDMLKYVIWAYSLDEEKIISEIKAMPNQKALYELFASS